MKRLLALLLLLAVHSLAAAQIRIDGSFPFQTDPAKKYSLYIPSTYEEGTPHRMMVGFHPLNTSRWDAESWCDTLIVFAEENGLLMACPDGGVDGRVDDPIDTAFTSALIDSMDNWYSVDSEKVYAMGFSWGGRATYTYGLNHVETFGGFIPIGAAINGTNEVNGVIENAAGKPFYLVHGALDAPNTRYFPILAALQDNNAIVESILMGGVGHTIDFPNRNAILGTAFQWVDSVNCALDPTDVSLPALDYRPLLLEPNPSAPGERFTLQLGQALASPRVVEVFDSRGRRLGRWVESSEQIELRAPDVRGAYLVRVEGQDGVQQGKIIVR